MAEQAAHLPWDDADKAELIRLPQGEPGSLLAEEWLASDSAKLERIADYYASPKKERKPVRTFAAMVGVNEHSLEAWRHHPKMRQRIAERFRAKACDALADGLEQASSILSQKWDQRAFDSVRSIVFGEGRAGAQVNVNIDARRSYSQGAVAFVEQFRKRQKRLFELTTAVEAEVRVVEGKGGENNGSEEATKQG